MVETKVADATPPAVEGPPMPSLLRFLTILITLGAVGFGVVYALATFVKPATREMVTPVPLTRIEQ